MIQMPIGYATFDHAARALIADNPVSEEHSTLFQLYYRTAMQHTFPCMAAQKAIRDFRVGFCLSPEPFNTVEGAELTVQYLYRWIQDACYALLKAAAQPTAFATCIVVFPHTEFQNESVAEQQLWEFLTKMHQYDRNLHPWSDESSSFVYDKEFSMSLGGYAQFILFLSQCAMMPSRQFPQPMLVFNPHFIFQAMRRAENFADWRDAIRKREESLHGGWRNPKLIDFGDGPEAPQYALTLDPIFNIGDCPFTGLPRPTEMLDYDMEGSPLTIISG
jgi:FPC/CPF motif-containing protein YcgG